MRSQQAVFVLVVLAGCSWTSPSSPFAHVQKVVEDRTGQQVRWSAEDTSDEAAFKKHISSLLQGEITVDQAVEVSLLNNPGLQAEYEELGIAKADLLQARILPNPVLSVERRFPGKATEADFSQSLLDLLLIRIKSQAAQSRLDATTNRVVQLVLDQAAEVKQAFYALQGELQRLEMSEYVVAALEASYRTSTALREAGNVSELDSQYEAGLLAHAKLEVAQARLKVLEHRERLNVMFGVWGENTDWKIKNRLQDIPSDEIQFAGLETFAMTHRPDLLAARFEYEAEATEAEISRFRAIFPDLTITGHFEREPDGGSSGGPSLDLPFPLFNWGRAASEAGSARARQALRRYEALAIEIRSKIRVAFGRMRAARIRVDYFHKELLPIREKVLQQTQLHYNGMFQGVLQLLQMKQAQIEAGREYIETLEEYWVARSALEREIGGSFRDLPLSHAPSFSHSPTNFSDRPVVPAAQGHHAHHKHETP